MRITFLLILIIAVGACADSDQEQDSSSTTKDSIVKKTEDPRMAPKTAAIQDREPEVEMVNINWVYHQDSSKALYKAWIQNKDAKYYLTDGVQGDTLSLELTGGHPAIQLIAIAPGDDGQEVFRENLGSEPVTWKTVYYKTGRYTLIVQLDPAFEGKEQLKTYFELKMRLY